MQRSIKNQLIKYFFVKKLKKSIKDIDLNLLNLGIDLKVILDGVKFRSLSNMLSNGEDVEQQRFSHIFFITM